MEYFEQWREALVDLAGAPNVVVKISGLGMGELRWTTESIRPWVLSCIEAFGVERSFFGTNWPVDRLFSSYPDVLNAYTEIIAGFPPDEQEALFSRQRRAHLPDLTGCRCLRAHRERNARLVGIRPCRPCERLRPDGRRRCRTTNVPDVTGQRRVHGGSG